MGNNGTQDIFLPFVSTLYRGTSLATVAGTSAASSIIGSSLNPNDSLMIPSNFWAVGKTIRFTIRGLYSTRAITPGSLTLVAKLGSTTLCTGIASSLLIGAVNQGFVASLLITCFSTGTNGSVMVMGNADYTTGVTSVPNSIPLNNGTNTVTVDTTTSMAFNAMVQWASADPNNSITSMVSSLEALN